MNLAFLKFRTSAGYIHGINPEHITHWHIDESNQILNIFFVGSEGRRVLKVTEVKELIDFLNDNSLEV